MVKIYSMPDCPYCNELKDLLTKDGIEFTDININLPQYEKEWENVSKFTKSDSVPIVKVGKQILVPNVSFHSIPQAAELTKKFLG